MTTPKPKTKRRRRTISARDARDALEAGLPALGKPLADFVAASIREMRDVFPDDKPDLGMETAIGYSALYRGVAILVSHATEDALPKNAPDAAREVLRNAPDVLAMICDEYDKATMIAIAKTGTSGEALAAKFSAEWTPLAELENAKASALDDLLMEDEFDEDEEDDDEDDGFDNAFLIPTSVATVKISAAERKKWPNLVQPLWEMGRDACDAARCIPFAAHRGGMLGGALHRSVVEAVIAEIANPPPSMVEDGEEDPANPPNRAGDIIPGVTPDTREIEANAKGVKDMLAVGNETIAEIQFLAWMAGRYGMRDSRLYRDLTSAIIREANADLPSDDAEG